MNSTEIKKHQILFVVREFYPFRRASGVISLLREYVHAFKGKTCDITILTIQKKGENKKYTYQGVPIYKFRQLNLLEYQKVIKNINPDSTIFLSSMTSTFHILLWWGLLRLGTPGKNLYFFQLTNPFSLKHNLLMQRFLRSFKNIFVTSIFIQRLFKENLNQETQLIFPGIDVNKLPSHRPRKTNVQRIGYFGHFVHIKGFDHFIRLATNHPEIEFSLVAGSPKKYSPNEKEAIDTLSQMSNVVIHGFVDNPLSLMATCDILVLPYRSGATVLGIAQSAIEAMGMGIPVIGTNNSALDSLITSGNNGFLCASIDEISQKIKLLSNEENVYNKLSINAQETVKNNHNILSIADNLMTHLT